MPTLTLRQCTSGDERESVVICKHTTFLRLLRFPSLLTSARNDESVVPSLTSSSFVVR